MSIIEILLIGIGLSMDAFAVSVCKGLKMTKINYLYTVIIAFFFGAFQAIMPVIGYFVGNKFQKQINNYDHWIAFGLLILIGGNMIYESVFKKDEEENEDMDQKLDVKELIVLAIATSIDALAVGVTFGLMLDDGEVITAVAIIGAITFVLSFIGIVIGNIFGIKYKNKAEVAGGIILILIGVKILLEHLQIINF